MPYRHEGERLVFDARTAVAPMDTVDPGESPASEAVPLAPRRLVFTATDEPESEADRLDDSRRDAELNQVDPGDPDPDDEDENEDDEDEADDDEAGDKEPDEAISA